MSSERIKEIEKKMQIVYSVYSIVETKGLIQKAELFFLEDFYDEESAVTFVIENISGYTSLTIIKRYV